MDITFLLIVGLSLLILIDRETIGPCLQSCYQKYDNVFLVFVFLLGVFIGNTVDRMNNKKEK